MRPLRLAAAVLLAALAAAAALLAGDVRAWRDSLAAGDAVYAVAPARADWTPAARLGGVAGSLLGVAGDVSARRALQLYRTSAAIPQRLDTAVEAATARAEAETALAAVARSADARRASQALTLLGVLAFGAGATGGGANQADAAVSDFTDAVRLDPENADAKRDLELLLRLSAAHGTRTGAGRSTGIGRGGRRGAGGGLPGSGY